MTGPKNAKWWLRTPDLVHFWLALALEAFCEDSSQGLVDIDSGGYRRRTNVLYYLARCHAPSIGLPSRSGRAGRASGPRSSLWRLPRCVSTITTILVIAGS